MESNGHGQPVGVPVRDWSARELPRREVIRGHHVTLEPVDARHGADLFDAVCGPGNDALWTYRPAARPETLADFHRDVIDVLAEHEGSASYVCIPRRGAASGLITFYPCVPSSGVVEISGVLLGPAMQRTTASTEAIHLMLVHAFDALGYRRVEWKCDSLNDASGRAARRLGFTYEGRFRQHMVVGGRNRDTDWYSLLDSEWPAARTRQERWLSPENFDSTGQQVRRLAES